MLSAKEVNSFFVGSCTAFLSVTGPEIESLIIEGEINNLGEISELAVNKELQKLNKNCASYPGELPLKLLREFPFSLSSHSRPSLTGIS